MKTANNIIIIEDEQLAYEKLASLVEKVAFSSKIQWLRSVKEVKSYLNKNSPDLIFSDIELLDGNVFDAFNEFSINCPIIFSTAYDKYLQDAFKSNGIAYLLKPFSEDEFLKIWNKYESLFSYKDNVNKFALTEIIKNHVKVNSYKSTFPIKKRDSVFLLKVIDIVYFQAQGDFVLAIDKKGNKHIINKTLANIEISLDLMLFFRINRSEIVNFNFILKYRPYIKNRLEIEFNIEMNKLYTSNSRSLDFKNWLDR